MQSNNNNTIKNNNKKNRKEIKSTEIFNCIGIVKIYLFCISIQRIILKHKFQWSFEWIIKILNGKLMIVLNIENINEISRWK